MADETALSGPCHLARLPYELRQRIFRYTLEQKGSISIQTPQWDHGSSFMQPLFAVSRTLRHEALEAFYQTNTFVWNVNRSHRPGAQPDSDPSKYPLEAEGFKYALAPSRPWHYPQLMKDLRHLSINVSIPLESSRAWTTTFPREIRSLVDTLDGGNKLKRLRIVASTAHWKSPNPPSEEQVETLRILFRWRVTGQFDMIVLPSDGPLSTAIFSLGREENVQFLKLPRRPKTETS